MARDIEVVRDEARSRADTLGAQMDRIAEQVTRLNQVEARLDATMAALQATASALAGVKEELARLKEERTPWSWKALLALAGEKVKQAWNKITSPWSRTAEC